MRAEILVGRERRRRWSADDKLQIVREAFAPGARVAPDCRWGGAAAGCVAQSDLPVAGGTARVSAERYGRRGCRVRAGGDAAGTEHRTERRLARDGQLGRRGFDRDRLGGWALSEGAGIAAERRAAAADPCGRIGMIGPGAGVRVYLACGVTDMRKGDRGLGRSGTTGAEPEPGVGCGLCLSRAPWRPDQAFDVGWPGLLPLLQGAGAGPVPPPGPAGPVSSRDRIEGLLAFDGRRLPTVSHG